MPPHSDSLLQKAKVVLVVVLVCLLAKDIYTSYNYPLVDLRNRVVGARAMNAGKSPYTYRWQPNDAASLVNPYDFQHTAFSLCTATPFFLLIFEPLAAFGYPAIKITWTIISFLAVAWMFWFIIRKPLTGTQQLLTGMIAALFFLANNWQQSIIQGQYYFMFPLLLLVGYRVVAHKNNITAFIVIAGFAILLRPILALVLCPLLLRPQYYPAIFRGAAILLIFTAVYMFTSGHLKYWKQYVASSGYWTEQYRESANIFINEPQVNQYRAGQQSRLPLEAGTGYSSFVFSAPKKINSQVINLTHLSKTILGKKVPLPYALGLWAVIVAGIICYLLFTGKRGLEDYLLTGFLIYYLFEISMPVPKNGYCFPELLFPLTLLGKMGRLQVAHLAGITFFLIVMCLPVKIFPLQLVGSELLIVAILVLAYLKPGKSAASERV